MPGAGLQDQVQQAQAFLEAEAGMKLHVQNVEMRAEAIKAQCEERVRYEIAIEAIDAISGALSLSVNI